VRICVCGVDGGVKVDPPCVFLIAAGGSKIFAGGGFNPPNPAVKYSPVHKLEPEFLNSEIRKLLSRLKVEIECYEIQSFRSFLASTTMRYISIKLGLH